MAVVDSPEGMPVRAYRSWTVFLHPRFGYELPVPPGVSALGDPDAATETTFVSRDGSFVMSAWGGLSPQSPTALFEAQWNLAQGRAGRAINYQRKARSWFVVSGTDRAGMEFYEKFIMRGDHVAACTLTYPRSRLREFEPWVEEIEDGFRVVTDPDYGPPEMAPRHSPVSTRAREISPLRRDTAETLERPDLADVVRPQSPRPGATSNGRPRTDSRDAAKSKIDLTPPPKKKTKPNIVETEAVTSRENATPPSAPDKTETEKLPGAKPTATAKDLPFGQPVVGRPGFVYSPFVSNKTLVDVVDIPAGTKVKCPYTGKIFRVP